MFRFLNELHHTSDFFPSDQCCIWSNDVLSTTYHQPCSTAHSLSCPQHSTVHFVPDFGAETHHGLYVTLYNSDPGKRKGTWKGAMFEHLFWDSGQGLQQRDFFFFFSCQTVWIASKITPTQTGRQRLGTVQTEKGARIHLRPLRVGKVGEWLCLPRPAANSLISQGSLELRSAALNYTPLLLFLPPLQANNTITQPVLKQGSFELRTNASSPLPGW